MAVACGFFMINIRYGFRDMKVTNKNVCIGDGVEIAEFVHIWGYMKPVTIGKNVWVGTGTMLFPGVSICDGAILGAGSIVSRNVKPGAVMVGFPVSVLFKLDNKEELASQ